jgi:hypothetical protein
MPPVSSNTSRRKSRSSALSFTTGARVAAAGVRKNTPIAIKSNGPLKTASASAPAFPLVDLGTAKPGDSVAQRSELMPDVRERRGMRSALVQKFRRPPL